MTARWSENALRQIQKLQLSSICRLSRLNLKICCQIPDVIEAIAKRKVILDTAAEAGIVVGDEELQQEGDRLRFAKKLVKATETWAWLKKHHLTLDNFEELAYNSVLSQKLAHHLFDSKVEPLFYQNQLDYVAAVTYEVIVDDWDLALELFFAKVKDYL